MTEVATDAQPNPWQRWLTTPAGRYLLAWEQRAVDATVANLFGYHALQCGLPELDALRANRMANRVIARLASDPVMPLSVPAEPAPADARVRPLQPVVVEAWEDIPFGTQSLDLVVLPHVLEFSSDPHQVLREVDRVLRPEGRVVVTGLNPVSLWGARHGVSGVLPGFLPRQADLIGIPRLRDWAKLLGFELEGGCYGCYAPPCRTARWLERMNWMEKAGDRWWPICGASYLLVGVKRVRGMRLVGPAWKRVPARAVAVAGPAPVRTEEHETRRRTG